MCEASEKGTPLMRPVFFENGTQNNESFKLVDSVYFWGDAFLVAPVLSKGQKMKTVNFPVGSNWFDLVSTEFIKSGAQKDVELEMDFIPVFVRGESFVPMVEGLQSTADYDPKNVVVHYFPDPSMKSGEGRFEYDDGGDKNNADIGVDRIHFESSWKRKKGMITVSSKTGNTSEMDFMLHFWSSDIVKIKVNGKKLEINQIGKEVLLNDQKFIGRKLIIEMKVKSYKN